MNSKKKINMINLLKIENNDKLKKLLLKMKQDQSITNQVNNILFIQNQSYIITYNDEYVGIIKIIDEMNDCSIEIGILNKYQNKNIGKIVINKIIEIIKLNYNYNKIILRTTYDNQQLISLALNNNFNLDIEEIEKSDSEGLNYIVYSKIIKKNKIKIK
ncbi:MAG: GNAT family N-acetyltransferase [Bacilli bacterium]|nr:GNAT family N-acetyltransferase [Bacilli bacterium]